MKWQMLCFVMLAIAGRRTMALADENAVSHRIMVVEYGAGDKNRIIEVDGDEKVTWQHRPPSICVQCQPLANGHVVYAYGGSDRCPGSRSPAPSRLELHR